MSDRFSKSTEIVHKTGAVEEDVSGLKTFIDGIKSHKFETTKVDEDDAQDFNFQKGDSFGLINFRQNIENENGPASDNQMRFYTDGSVAVGVYPALKKYKLPG